MNKNNKPIIAAIIIVALLIIIGAVFASGILAHDDDEQAAYEVNFIDGEQVIKTITVKENHLVTRINDPVKEGYIFAGWYTDQELTNEFTFDDTYITNNLTLYAKWVKASEPEPGDITYTVTFNTNGANSISPQIVKAGDKAVKPADPLKSGYKFVGWYSDSSFTTLFDFQSPITFDITLYAKFTSTGGGGGGSVTPPVTDTKFTVTYNGNENTAGTVPAAQTLSENTSIRVQDKNSLEKSGHSFVGWNTKADGTGTNYAVNDTISFEDISNDLTLYAKWALGTYAVDGGSNVTVELDENQVEQIINSSSTEGTVTLVDASAINNEVTSVSLNSSTLQQVNNQLNNQLNKDKKIEISLPNASIKLGKNALENILSKNGGDISFSASKVNLDQSILSSNQSVSIDENSVYEFNIGGSGGNFGETITVSIPYDLDGADEEHIVVYYLKDGQLLQITGKYNPLTGCVEVETDHFSKFAVGNNGRFAVTFDLDGGVFPENFVLSDYVHLKFGAQINIPTPVKIGYDFQGWYTDSNTLWDSNTAKIKKNLVLHAHWTPIEYGITYELNGGSASGNPDKYTIETNEIVLNTPTYSGHTFQGWFVDSDCKTPFNYVKGVTYGNLIIYADWKLNEYLVTLSSGTGYELNTEQQNLVDHGKDFSFVVTLDEDYKNSNITVKDVDGKEISHDDAGLYTLENITKDQIVTVEGITATTYNVIFADVGNAYSVDNQNPVEQGKDFTFTISLDEAYSQSNPLSLQIYGKYDSITNDHLTYTVKNVNSDLVILVNGLQKNTYTVTFISNGQEILKQNVTHGEPASLISNLTRPGYEFKGWSLEENGAKYVDQPITANTTLYALWSTGDSNYFIYVYQEKTQYSSEANKYELIKVEQSSGAIDQEVSANIEKYHTDDLLVAKAGFKLNEKVSKTTGTISSESPLILSLYFDRVSFIITFYDKTSEITQTTAKYGTPTNPADVRLPNVILDYWYESDETIPYLFTTMPAENLKLYAKYVEVYKLSYDSNGGKGNLPLTVQYQAGTEVILFGPGYPHEDSYLLTKEGYRFGGWDYDGTTYQFGLKHLFEMPSQNVTLKALWLPNPYTITFESNGGSAVEDITANYGTNIDKPTAPAKTGYIFAGWFKDAECTQAWDFAADTVPVNGTTLYAKWTANKYTLTINYVFEDNSQAHEPHVETIAYNSTYEVKSPEITGYLPDRNTVIGTISGDATITVTYGAYVASIGEKNYRTLEDALEAAVAGDKVILLRDYTLTQNVTVPQDVFLVLPCADDDQGYDLTVDYETEHNPDGAMKDAGVYSSLYRTLTVSETATITLDGQLLVNAVTGRANGGYLVMDVTGGYAQIILEGNIIVKNAGILEVCGYITGNGQITAESGAEVRELYLVQHWRGGSQALAIYPDLFPFNEYDCHAIQSKIRVDSGASLFGNVKMYETMYDSYHYTRFPQIDNANGLIKLAKGAHAIVSFDSSAANGEASTDVGRTTIELYGGATFSHSTLTIVGLDLSTKDFIYPIDGDISFGLYDGDYFIENSFKLLTGVEVTLYENSSLTLNAKGAEVGSNNSKLEKNTLVLYDEFNDVDNTGTTEYPQRPAAVLNLRDGSTFNIYGTFAGIINFEGELGNAVVNTENAVALELDTIEVNGYIGNDAPSEVAAHGFVHLHFETKYQYLISFNSNGGSELASLNYFAGDEVKLPLPEKEGHVFQGWYLDSSLTQPCSSNAITSGNLTLYAKWGLLKYIVSFNSNEGTNVPSQEVFFNELVTKPSDPLRSGFNFLGWYADKDLTQEYDFAIPVTENTTLYAKWEAIEYTVSFVTNGSELLEDLKYTTEFDSLAIPEINKLGYDFQGWYSDKELASSFMFKPYETVGDLILYAKWAPTSYTIAYYDQTQLDLTPNTYTIEESVTLATPEKVGYNFAGWHEESDFSDDAVFSINIGTIGNKTYYASWIVESYSILYFDSNNPLTLSPDKYTITERVVLPTPSKEGYNFEGWYDNADFSGSKVNSIPVGSSGDKTFYAKFTINQYAVSFNSNGGSAVEKITADYGTNIDEPTAPAKTGYIFAGWFKDAECTQAWDFAVDTVPVNGTTLYAKWTLEVYTINLYNNHDFVDSIEYSIESDSVELQELPKEGYTFDGWYLAGATKPFEYVKGTTIGDFDLHAKLDLNQYTISFNSNGGSAVENIIADYGTSITKPDDPTRTGYTFAGWFKDADCLTVWNFEVDTVPADDITLHAKWIANSYTVVFHANNGTTDTTSQNFKYDEAQNLTVNTFTKEGYNFLGWSESSSGDVKYADKVSVSNLTADNNGTINLYAVWSAQIFSVIYNNNGGEGSIENTSATYDSTVVLNNGADFSRVGHSLTAWNTMADGSGTEYALDYKFEPWKLTDNLTLYAQWTVNSSTISFNSNGGSAVEEITANYGTTITEPTAPDKEGHTFAGWYTDEALKNKYTFTTMPAESITLYAKWTVNQYTVTYYVDGGKYQSYDIEYGGAVTKPADPIKAGHTFKDWGAEIPAIMPAENLTFNAVFDINKYTITYRIDNAEVETQIYSFGATITAYQPASIDGKTFSGWSPELPDTMPDHNITVSGSFNANTYTISYYVDGNQYDTPLSVEFGETIIPMNQPTKEGHTFSDWVWYKVEGGSETELEAAPATMPAYHLVVRGSFTINTYEVTFHPNNIDKDSTVPVDYGSLIEVPSVSAKKGYTLEGWCTDALMTNKWDFTTDTMPAENIDLYANWTRDTYTIKFYNGNELFKSIEYTIETKSIEIPDFSKEGYTFSGWFAKDSSSEFFYSPGVTVGNIDVYAKLKLNSYTITFDSNGGSDGGHITQDYDSTLGKLPTPTYDGYNFIGWFEDNGTFSKAFTATKMPAGDITLYAKWEVISYNITYVLNGGTNDPANPTSYTVETATITLQDATKEGYTFDGWYGTIDCIGEPILEIPSQSVGDKTFYAKFTPNNYTIVFHANNGTTDTMPQNFKYDEAQNLTANTFTKEGYTFQGWSESLGGDVKYADEVSVSNLTADNNGTIDLYAVWQINQYTISFNSNGGSAVSAITANYGTKITKPVDPTLAGHKFAGWFKDAECTQAWDFAVDTVPVNGTTLYAQWTAEEYTITFNSNGGSAVSAITANYGTKITKPVDPTLAGHKFAGWFKDAECTQAWDFAVDTVPVNGTTLYAKWTAEEYTITFNSNGGSVFSDIVYVIGDPVTLPNPSKSGYEFDNWYVGNLPFTYKEGETIGDYDLVAKWNVILYGINYKDGENDLSESGWPVSYTYENSQALPTTASKMGHTFAGWYTDSTFTSSPVTSIPSNSTGDKTFYAKFTPNEYTVIFNANGGAGTMNNQAFTYGVSQKLTMNAFSKDNYDFQGWSSKQDSTEIDYQDGQEVINLASEGSIKLYAVWTLHQYKITYILDGGENDPLNKSSYTINDADITLGNPTRTGYSFRGWTGEGTQEPLESLIIPKGSTGDRVYTANWTPVNYRIAFNANGGVGTMSNVNTYYDTSIQLPKCTFTKDGYTFAGWSKDQNATVAEYSDEELVKNLASTKVIVKLYAVWAPGTHQITLPNNELAGYTYTASAAMGYDENAAKYLEPFEFIVTFDNALLDSQACLVMQGTTTLIGTTSDNLTYTFRIESVPGEISSLILQVVDIEEFLNNFVSSHSSPDYVLEKTGKTITVSIKNVNGDPAELINILSIIGSITPNPTRASEQNLLAYLPSDDILWEDNAARYAIDFQGYTIVFKQDTSELEKIKLEYLTKIEQAVRLFRDNTNWYPVTKEGIARDEVISTSAGIEYIDGVEYKYIDLSILYTKIGSSDVTIFDALTTNFVTVMALIGHEDLRYGTYSADTNFGTNLVEFGDKLFTPEGNINGNYISYIYNQALFFLKEMGLPITTIKDPLANCFDLTTGEGYGGFARQYCIDSENGLRYTDIYHFKFTNCTDANPKPVTHNLINAQNVPLQYFGPGNSLVDSSLVLYRNAYASSMLGVPASLDKVYESESTRFVEGELVVFGGQYSQSNLTVTSSTGSITWYDEHSFIMPAGDVTISIKN